MSAVVGIVCDREAIEVPAFGALSHHVVFVRYVEGLALGASVIPMLIPASAGRDQGQRRALLSRLDGLVLPGSASNVDPARYGGPADDSARDLHRDETSLPLIVDAIDLSVPVLGICRGMQELNVALGGTLVPDLEHDGPSGHRPAKTVPFERRYDPTHRLQLVEGGWLAQLVQQQGVPASALTVNSLHRQAVARLGDGLFIEARAADGIVEAVAAPDAPALTVGVQWHLEWHVDRHPLHAAILGAFGRACARRAALRPALHPTRVAS